ncbi:probable ATP-dependent RNA helicase DHX37 [Oppia nitens]|uniref:probable ATP-dependent RNA helicase DHX37 n=1 Tax=Oppia nitens TaxID=1686743 RepID=UPI0023DB19F2|nr:probable ATP-dependent RNA helicase DHX37 [Oppia nitens]
MVRNRKGHNWKGRQSASGSDNVTETVANKRKLMATKIDIDVDETKYDSCNALVVESNKDKLKPKKAKDTNGPKQRILSKKQKKKLEKVLERKDRKINRAKLLQDLQEFRAEDKEMALMSSTSDVQTFGRKRLFDMKTINSVTEETDDKNEFILKKYKKFKKLTEKPKHVKDLNVISAFDESESSDDSSDSDSIVDPNDGDINTVNADNGVPQVLDNCSDNSNGISNDCEKVDDVVKSDVKCESKPIETKPTEDKVNETTATEMPKKDIEEQKKDKKEIPKKEVSRRQFQQINRTEDMDKYRSALPIINEEHTVMDAVFNNQFVIICGETGSGKTTQVPQFLFEAGFVCNQKLIGVTEPRRVAAIAMSKRVAEEMNVSTNRVSYQIRFESNVTPETQIKFMTDGVLLKEIQNDFLLKKYSAIIVDEAHERSLYSDILIGLLSRIVPLREKKGDPLKLIVMSATLRVEDFVENKRLFKSVAPVIKIDSRQYPVSVHFNKKTNSDYLHEAFKKVCKIHSESPAGGILVFVTGRAEVEVLCRRLRAKYPNTGTKYVENKLSTKKKIKDKKTDTESDNKIELNNKLKKTVTINLDDYEVNPLENESQLDDLDYSDDENNDQLIKDVDSDDSDNADDGGIAYHNSQQPLYCLPLYSLLPHSQQVSIFKEPPTGCRLCVVATNVAETSLTIPNVKYVVDTGKVKTKVYDNVTGISTFIITWSSKASADQRAGRAGRTGPGHCYRLYSSAIFNDEFLQYSEPEILRKPADDLMLQMKSMNIENVVNFPFPSQPSTEAMIAAEKRLIVMGALKDVSNLLLSSSDKKPKNYLKATITPLGKAMSHFPISPRYAKMLALSRQHQLMSYTIAIVAGLTVQEIFIDNKNTLKRHKKWFTNESDLQLGDIMVLLNSIGATQFAGLTDKFCKQNGLRYKAFLEINKLRKQLRSQISQICGNNSGVEEEQDVNNEMSPPNATQIKLLRQIMLSGFFDRIARKVPVLDVDMTDKEKKKLKSSYQSIEVENPVFISHNSILSDELPEYVVYQELFETTATTSSSLQMRNVVTIDPQWLPVFVPQICKFSNPLERPEPRYDCHSDTIKCHRSATFGPYDWPIQATEVTYPDGLEKYKYFAKFLLEGHVIKFFKSYSSNLLSSPIILVKSWANLQPRTERLLNALISQKIDSKNSLVNKWKSDPKYLLKQYIDWLPQSYHQTIRTQWPPID